MTFSEAITACMGNYAIFRGRARRAEFWWFLLFCILMHWAASLTAAVSGAGWDFDQRFHHTFFERPVFDRISDDGKEASSINIRSGWARGGHLTWNEEGRCGWGAGAVLPKSHWRKAAVSNGDQSRASAPSSPIIAGSWGWGRCWPGWYRWPSSCR